MAPAWATPTSQSNPRRSATLSVTADTYPGDLPPSPCVRYTACERVTTTPAGATMVADKEQEAFY